MNSVVEKYGRLIFDYAQKNYRLCLREATGALKEPFIVPGSVYADELWDWDSWLTGIALFEIADEDISDYEKGCVLNFLDHIQDDGKIPIVIQRIPGKITEYFSVSKNSHKPCLAQHALLICQKTGSFEWLRDRFADLEKYVDWYDLTSLHESGLYFWQDDFAIGVDNDPCTFYRPPKSSASIYLNCLMYKELEAMVSLSDSFGLKGNREKYSNRMERLRKSIRNHCWDERDGFFYSVDLNLLPIDNSIFLHSGAPRHWNTIIQRIDVWTGFMPMWAGIATQEQAERMLSRYLDEKTFNAPYGVRTLSKLEKMYTVQKTGNPSCWLGPVWGISNYMVFDGLRKYGFDKEARILAEKTINMLGKDIEKCGEMHEYYDPENGLGVNNQGFQNWNLLAISMCKYLNH